MTAYAQTVGLVDGALSALEAERQVINDLNVYPVPDGDTGTNLYLTVHAVREELERTGELSSAEIAPTVARGSLMGARGNSGVILSQIVRGMCSVYGPGEQLSTATVKAAFNAATTAAYRAVKKPVEGTMLTVVREMATAAADLRDEAPLQQTMEAVLAAGALAVERTTDQLAALREAGVVDAGGYGLLVICRGLAAAIFGEASGERAGGVPPAGVPVGLPDGPTELSRFRYCTSFLLSGPDLPRDELEGLLTESGDSELVVGDAEMLKVHVHTDDPGAVLSWAVRHGSIAEVEINDMHAQTRERDERLAAARTHGRTVVVAVAAGAGNHELFRELGCAGIVDGGQSMNPSAAQLLAVFDELGSDEVVVLPNNKNIVLTAEQAAAMTTRTVVVVPSSSMPAGLAAMVAFEAEKDAVTKCRPDDRRRGAGAQRRDHRRRPGLGRRRGGGKQGRVHRTGRRYARGRRTRPPRRARRRAQGAGGVRPRGDHRADECQRHGSGRRDDRDRGLPSSPRGGGPDLRRRSTPVPDPGWC